MNHAQLNEYIDLYEDYASDQYDRYHTNDWAESYSAKDKAQRRHQDLPRLDYYDEEANWE